MTPFGLHVRQLREARGLSQKQMAADLNLSPAYLSALEHGKRGKPPYALLQRMVGYFNIIWDEAETFHAMANLSDPRVVVDTSDLSPAATELANRLAQKIGGMDEDEIKGLIKELR
ncbi:MAG: helix-turn-helix transcriptional regulator [Pseudomonadota bacterium]